MACNGNIQTKERRILIFDIEKKHSYRLSRKDFRKLSENLGRPRFVYLTANRKIYIIKENETGGSQTRDVNILYTPLELE